MPPHETMPCSRPPLTPLMSYILDRCGHCEREVRRSESDRPLKRCAGCARTAYCNKDCQKAAWPSHKMFCRRAATLDPRPLNNDPDAAAAFREAFGRFGFTSDLHQRQLLHDYIQVHDWALRALMRVLICDNTKPGSTHWDAFAQSQKAIRFVLNLNPALACPGPELDPGRTFRLKEYAVVDRGGDWSAELSEDWMEEGRAVAEEHSKQDPHYVGLVPLCYVVEETGYKRWLFVPIHRIRRPRGPMDDTMSRRFQGLVRLCVESTRAGFPLCAVDQADENMIVALPGRLVRNRAWWAWRPLFPEWAHYRPGLHVEFDKAVMEKLGPALAGNPSTMERTMMLFRTSL